MLWFDHFIIEFNNWIACGFTWQRAFDEAVAVADRRVDHG